MIATPAFSQDWWCQHAPSGDYSLMRASCVPNLTRAYVCCVECLHTYSILQDSAILQLMDCLFECYPLVDESRTCFAIIWTLTWPTERSSHDKCEMIVSSWDMESFQSRKYTSCLKFRHVLDLLVFSQMIEQLHHVRKAIYGYQDHHGGCHTMC